MVSLFFICSDTMHSSLCAQRQNPKPLSFGSHPKGNVRTHGEPEFKGFFTASATIKDGNVEEPTNREAVLQLHEATSPRYAVFLRSPSGLRANFKFTHDSLDSAIECCRKYAAEKASLGHVDYTYYAVEIKHRVGIEHGKIVDEQSK